MTVLCEWGLHTENQMRPQGMHTLHPPPQLPRNGKQQRHVPNVLVLTSGVGARALGGVAHSVLTLHSIRNKTKQKHNKKHTVFIFLHPTEHGQVSKREHVQVSTCARM